MPDTSKDSSADANLGRDTTEFGTNPDHDVSEEPDGARGSGTEHGLTSKLKQGLNAVTGRDLDTASPEQNERDAQSGAGGNT
jgi:hypothetical protein